MLHQNQAVCFPIMVNHFFQELHDFFQELLEISFLSVYIVQVVQQVGELFYLFLFAPLVSVLPTKHLIDVSQNNECQPLFETTLNRKECSF